jgi:hypothetical protein
MGGMIQDAYRCERGNERLTNDVYGSLLALAAQWGFDIAAAAVELERQAKRPAALRGAR